MTHERLKALILEAAKRPRGFDTATFTGYSVAEVSRQACQLQKKGLLFVAKLSHRSVRYFDSQEMANACQSAEARKPLPKPKVHARAPWDPNAPMVITAKTIYTYGKSPIDPTKTGTFSE